MHEPERKIPRLTFMVSQFSCQACHLRFSLGAYHGHDFRSGYAGGRYGVCRACGTQHLVNVALTDRGPEYYDLFEVTLEALPDAARVGFMAWFRKKNGVNLQEAAASTRQLPLVVARELWEHSASDLVAELSGLGAAATSRIHAKERNAVFGPVLPSQLYVANGPAFGMVEQNVDCRIAIDTGNVPLFVDAQFNAAVPCGHCGAIDSLISQLDESCPCFLCQGSLKNYGNWIT